MKRALTFARRFASAMVLASAVGLASCGQGQQAAGPAAPQPIQNPYTWTAIAPTTIVDPGPPARLALSGGYAAAVFEQTAVRPGDAVTANFTIQGTAGQYVRGILQRHCNSENGEDLFARDFLLTGEPQQEQLALTFGTPYDCIRLSFVSNGHQNLELTVHDLSITKTP